MNIMKKFLIFVSVFAFLTAIFIFGENFDKKVFAASKTLKVGTNVGYVPFIFKKNNELVGFEVDLIKAIAEKMNCEIKFYDYVFDDLISVLNRNEVDLIISSITINDERKSQISFSDSYFKSGLSIVSNKKINSLSDLNGKNILVGRGTTGEKIAKNVQGANVLEFEILIDKFSIVKYWNDSALITDRPAIEYILKNDKSLDGLKIFEKNLTTEDYGIGVRKSDTKLQKEINAALKNLKNSGEYQKIYDKWFK